MENVAMDNKYCSTSTDVDENRDVKVSRSAQTFQNFMYELFEKNGVMNDLRSYLRGHIVNVIRSAQTGDPPLCQKNFTQRLELTFQAFNILIAEYLLRLEFSYTLSVFISEIPLANMVFSFAKTLMQKVDNDDSKPKFKESDVWCILNYLGVKCDSDHASSIVEMYKLDGNSPLLLCILKSAPLFKEPVIVEPINSSQESITDSIKSSESLEENKSPERKLSFQEKCRHYVFCKTCQSKMIRIKEKYKKKKRDIAKNLKESNLNSLNVDSLMTNISLMERSLIDEMFEQLKSVYEAEMELVKGEEEKRVQRSLATHSTQLQKRRDEMEESFKAREVELENNVEQKKRFLWGLARALREQHQHMTRAMHDVRAETNRLSAKEDNFKSQLAEAEEILRQRGEDMRQQISAELVTLETHLECMKRERDSINRERIQLEQYKDRSNEKLTENEDIKTHYDLLRNEFNILKKYLESAKLERKCVVERGTLTDHDTTSKYDVVLNNEQEERRCDDGRAVPKKVINNLKKPKIVNFSQSNLDELYRERSLSRSRSSASSEAGDAQFDTDHETIQRLRDENTRLRSFARQQREHIDSLTSQQVRMQAALSTPSPAHPVPRPRTAPNPLHHALDTHVQRINGSASVNNFSFGWRKGAGEELSFITSAQPRIVLPGESIPFVGVVTRQTDNRRYLINQWRSLRRRISPLCGGGVTKLRASSPIQRNLRERPESTGQRSITINIDQVQQGADQSETCLEGEIQPEEYLNPAAADRRSVAKTRDKSPKTVLREAKEKLRNKDAIKDCAPIVREKSPNCLLREAKLRLRKLEIEAEAVEKSYLDFRRTQEVFRDERNTRNIQKAKSIVASVAGRALESKPSTSTYKLDELCDTESTLHHQEPTPNNYDKFMKEYQTKVSIGEHFKNKNSAAFIINPIPKAFSDQDNKQSENYIETPLTEFRKYYQTGRRLSGERHDTPSHSKSPNREPEPTSLRRELIRQAKHEKELKILKQNIGKIYNVPEDAIVEISTNQESNNDANEWDIIRKEESKEGSIENASKTENENDQNLLRIEVESVSEVNNVKVTESQSDSMLLIVESSIDNNKDAEISESENMITPLRIIVSPKRSPRNVNITETTPKESDRFQTTPKNDSDSETTKSSRKLNIRKGSIKLVTETKSPKRENFDTGNTKSVYIKPKDVAIYQDDKENVSSVVMLIDGPKEVLDNTLSELEHNEDPDYADDFSADVDNYNSRSEYGYQSPISQPKTSEDENFWDS